MPDSIKMAFVAGAGAGAGAGSTQVEFELIMQAQGQKNRGLSKLFFPKEVSKREFTIQIAFKFFKRKRGGFCQAAPREANFQGIRGSL
jgi:hypothetical protein